MGLLHKTCNLKSQTLADSKHASWFVAACFYSHLHIPTQAWLLALHRYEGTKPFRAMVFGFQLHFIIIILSTLYSLVGRNQPKTGDRCAIVRRRGEGLGSSLTPPTFMRVDYVSGRLVTWRQRKHCAASSAPAAGAPPSTSSTTISRRPPCPGIMPLASVGCPREIKVPR